MVGMYASVSETDATAISSSLTLVYGNTCEEGGLWIKYLDLRSINSEGNTVVWNVRVDGDQGVWARRNSEDPIAGEVSHGKAGVLDPKIRVREGERCARCKAIVLRTECQHVQNDSLLVARESPMSPELTLAKYRLSQVRSHCAAATAAAKTRHMALNKMDGSIVGRGAVVMTSGVCCLSWTLSDIRATDWHTSVRQKSERQNSGKGIRRSRNRRLFIKS